MTLENCRIYPGAQTANKPQMAATAFGLTAVIAAAALLGSRDLVMEATE